MKQILVKTEILFVILGRNGSLKDLDKDHATAPYILVERDVEVKRIRRGIRSSTDLGLIADDTYSLSDHIYHFSAKLKRNLES